MIDFNKYADMHENKDVIGKDGTEVKVRNHIPYASKVEMAQGIVENYLMIHDDSVCYTSHMISCAIIAAIIKYYTDVPVDGVDVMLVADFAINNEVIKDIREFIYDDYVEFDEILQTMIESVSGNIDDDHSLKKAIKTSFGFLFNGEDITESLAKAEATKNTMFRALSALNEKEQAEQRKVQNGVLNIGGTVLNLAKKEE